MGMKDKDLIDCLRHSVGVSDSAVAVANLAADRIEQLVQELKDKSENALMWQNSYVEENDRLFQAYIKQNKTEAKLAKAVEGLKFYAEKDDYEKQVIVRAGGELTYTEEPIILDDKGNLARKVLAELEKTE